MTAALLAAVDRALAAARATQAAVDRVRCGANRPSGPLDKINPLPGYGDNPRTGTEPLRGSACSR